MTVQGIASCSEAKGSSMSSDVRSAAPKSERLILFPRRLPLTAGLCRYPPVPRRSRPCAWKEVHSTNEFGIEAHPRAFVHSVRSPELLNLPCIHHGGAVGHNERFTGSCVKRLAIPGRLELPTFGLGNRCSVQLSYGTTLAL